MKGSCTATSTASRRTAARQGSRTASAISRGGPAGGGGVRGGAGSFRGPAGPTGLTAPPFEAVLERAAQRRASRSRVRPPVALAWAAGLALALTVGWDARGLL